MRYQYVNRKSYSEKKEHQKKYQFYNSLFGDLSEKQKIYSKAYYTSHRKEILREKRKPADYHLITIQKCEYDCFSCPYDDCIIPIPKTRQEYMKLYYSIFHDDLLKKKAIYRSEHRTYLSNSEKLRNYKKKGYIMSKCIFKETNNPDYEKYKGTFGILTIIKINKNDYISFISIDREFSFRAKIDKRLNDLNNPLCTEAYYSDCDGYEYTFESTVNTGNPLWEMEKGTDFVKC